MLFGTSASSLEGDGDQAFAVVDPITGNQTLTVQFPAKTGDIIPDCFASLPDGHAMMCTLASILECLVMHQTYNLATLIIFYLLAGFLFHCGRIRDRNAVF